MYLSSLGADNKTQVEQPFVSIFLWIFPFLRKPVDEHAQERTTTSREALRVETTARISDFQVARADGLRLAIQLVFNGVSFHDHTMSRQRRAGRHCEQWNSVWFLQSWLGHDMYSLLENTELTRR